MKNYKITIFILSLIFLLSGPLFADQDKHPDFLKGYCGSDVLGKAFQNLGILSDKIDSATKELNASYDSNRGLNSLYEIKNAAKESGLHAMAYEADLSALRKMAKNSQLILNITENKHFCLVKAITEKGVSVYDPGVNHKNFEVPFHLFEKIWDGKLLAISKKRIDFSKLSDIKRELKDDELRKILGGGGCGNCSGGGGTTGGVKWTTGNGPSDEDSATTGDPVVIWNGNLALHVKDITIPTRSLPLDLTRYYNAQVVSEVPGWHPDPGSGSWVIENGKYSGEGDRTTTDNKFQDFTLEIDMKTISSSTSNAWDMARIYFRYTENPQVWRQIKDSYYFLIHKDKKVELAKVINGTFSSLTNKYTTYSPYDNHRIKIQTSGSNIKIYIDGSLQINYTDPSPLLTSGRIALEASFSHVHFDNATIICGCGTSTYNFDTDDNFFIFGYGWTHSYGLRINQYSDHVTLVRENGAKEIYYQSAPNVYTYVAYNKYNTLTKDSTGFTLKTKYGVVYRFDLSGKLLYIEDRNQNRTTLTYSVVNGQEVPTEIVEPAGRKIILQYGANGMVSKAIDPLGNFIQYNYDASGHLIKVIDRRGNEDNYTYDLITHNITRFTDKEGNAYNYTYTYADRVNNQTDPLGNVTTFDYLWSDVHVINNRGQIYNYNFDNHLFLQSITDPNDIMERTTNDENGNVTNYYDKNNNHTNFTYDANGNKTGIYNAQGAWTRFTFETTYNQPTSFIDQKGNVTTFSYDSKGNLVQTVNPEGGVTTNVYNQYGQIISITDPKGNVTRFTYDAYGNIASRTDALSHVTIYSYDILGRVTKVTDPQVNFTEYTYDANGNLSSVKDPLGNITTYTYTRNGKLASVTNPLGNITNYTYDCFGSLLTVTDALGSVTTYAYDTVNQMHLNKSNLLSIADAKGNAATYNYDSLDRLIKMTDAQNQSYQFTYDNQGNLITRADANSKTTAYQYDVLNRLYRINYPDAAFVNYSFDSVGNIIQMQDSTGITSYLYDKLNRLKIPSYPDGTTIVYTYDLNGNRIMLDISLFGKIFYDYDSLNRLATITAPDGKTTQFSYDNLSRRTQTTYPNGAITTYTYDNSSRLTQLINKDASLQDISRFTYAYDNASRRTMVNLLNGSVNYTYDKLNQLTLESGTIDAQSFSLANTYDMLGNRLTLNEDNKTTNYTYNSLNQLTQSSGSTQKLIQVKGTVSDASPVTVKVNGINAIISLGQFTANNVPLNSGLNAIKAEATDSAGNINSHQINVTYNPTNPTITYTYDKNGNLIQRKVNTTTETFTYDYENRLKTYSSPTQTATYTYNGLGKRVSKTVNGTTTQYYYDGNEVISEKTASSSIYYIHSNRIDELISDSRGYSYHYDGLGSLVNLTDASGVKVASYNYKAFGDMRSQSGAVSNAWLFTGRQFDSESGLYFNRNRFYDARIGRFITQDPSLRFGARPVIPYLLLTHLNDPRQLHSYLYCINSPVNLRDPLGLRPWSRAAQDDSSTRYRTRQFEQFEYILQQQYKVGREETHTPLDPPDNGLPPLSIDDVIYRIILGREWWPMGQL